jgi:hypothetical protein
MTSILPIQLEAALQSHRYDVAIDRRGISGGEDWRVRLGGLIRYSDTVIFVLSPSSADSELCKWEFEEASRLGKRIIPVPCRPMGDATVPPQLSALNYILFYAEPRLQPPEQAEIATGDANDGGDRFLVGYFRGRKRQTDRRPVLDKQPADFFGAQGAKRMDEADAGIDAARRTG